jgi:hypothetical protein
MKLCHKQQQYYDAIFSFITSSHSEFLPSLLLIGGRGIGKRTIARTLARKMDFEFIEVRLQGEVSQIKEILFGNEGEARTAPDENRLPGDLGSYEPTLFYLSGLEQLDRKLFQTFQRIIERRVYVDALGNRWTVSENLWLLSSLTFPHKSATVDPNHRLCTAFKRRFYIEFPSDIDDVQLVACNMAQEFKRNLSSEPSMLEFLPVVSRNDDHFHTLYRLLERASVLANETITVDNLNCAMIDDVEWVLSKIIYRGHEISKENFKKWLHQFPNHLQPLAISLISKIERKYYIGLRSFHTAIGKLIQDTRISSGKNVVFCKWQKIGDSAERITHIIKNQAGWKNDREINLLAEVHKQTKRWQISSEYKFIIADDFVGTGKTLASLLAQQSSPIIKLLEKFPKAKLFILIIVGFESAIRSVMKKIDEYRERIHIIVYQTLTEQDRCFDNHSLIILDSNQRDKFEEFCLDTADRCMKKLPDKFWLGYEETGAITVFTDSIPNNSLPILWYSGEDWVALFPRSGLGLTGDF